MFCPRCGTWASDDTAACGLCGVALLAGHGAGTVAPTPTTRPEVPVLTLATYGGFWRRFMAVLLDTLALFFPAATVRVLLGLDAFGMFDGDASLSYMATAFDLLINWLYAAILIASPLRGTLGMIVMDLHVTDLKGDRISFSRATWRFFAQFLSLLTLGIGYVMQLFTARRQTLHDMVSGTVVVRPRRDPAFGAAPAMRLVS